MVRLDVPLFLATTVAILSYFFLFLHGERQPGLLSRLLLLPVISIGLAPSIALSVLRGVWSKGGVFERTPKFGIVGKAKLPVQSFLYRRANLPYLFLNSILFCYSLLPVVFACQWGIWYALPLFALFPCGFLYVIIQEMREAQVQSGEQAEISV
jgi:hypothetical protein